MGAMPRSSRRVLRALKRFRAIPAERRALSIEAVIALGVARLLVLTLPIRWIAPRLEPQAALAGNEAASEEILREIGRAVRTAASKTPWHSACLAQALAGKWMLARRRVRGSIRLGVAKDDEGKLRAHAWLFAGDTILTGGEQPLDRFTSLGNFE